MSRLTKNINSGWSLYWVTSDGDEDCFVVARNSRSAARVEVEYCGFDSEQVEVIRVKSISLEAIKKWKTRRSKDGIKLELPWYVDKWLLKKQGAIFRERGTLSETLIDDVVYTNSCDGPVRPRTIGREFLRKFKAEKAFQEYGHEDQYSQSQEVLFLLLGICLARTQEIEHLIAHSFILGVFNKTDRKKNLTIDELIQKWKRKTLGQMLKAIEEDWEMDPMFHAGLRWFLRMRNELVHGFTTSEQYDFQTVWGQNEAVAFLSFYEFISRPLREAFKATMYASLDIGNKFLLKGDSGKQLRLTKVQKEMISLFVEFFNLKTNMNS